MNRTHRRTLLTSFWAAVFAMTPLVGADDSPQPKPQTKNARQPKPRPQRKAGPMTPIEDVAGLPRVLLLGDSISIGYTLPTRAALKGAANVHRAPANCGPTTRGLQGVDKWLGAGKWDVIHFNFGLHDLKFLGPNGENLADPAAEDSRQQVPPEAYERNLRKLVARLKQTEAKLIWCSTTPVPAGAKGRVVGDSAEYNAIAERVMKENNIPINDLFAFAEPQLDKIQRPRDVHFTPAGSKQLAAQVAKHVRAALDGSALDGPATARDR